MNEDLINLAKAVAAVDKRLKEYAANPHAKQSDVNRLEAQVMGMRKEIDFATKRVETAAVREFEAKRNAIDAHLGAGLERVKTELAANVRGLNPRGEWKQGMVLDRNDVVTLNGTSYLVLKDGTTEKPAGNKPDVFQVLAKRGGTSSSVSAEYGKVGVPASASASGAVGEWSYDAEYYYRCVAANTWVRTSLATW